MDKKVMITLLLILLIPNTFAQEEFELEAGEISQADLILKQAQENILKTGEVSLQLDQMASTNVANLETIAGFIIQKQNEATTSIVITLILVTLASQGLWWAIYLYFQTKGLLPNIKPPKTKQKKENKKTPLNLQEVFE